MARKDIKLVENDLVFAYGDFVVYESDQQHIEDTINSFPSWWKQYPDEGVGVRAWLGAPTDTQALAKKIRLQLENDGYTVTNPKVNLDVYGKLIIEPNATI
jgi:hypothetical protein